MAPANSLDEPDATVVIVDWNEPEVTLEAVRSVLAQEGPSFEVIVVDNGSDSTADGHPAAALPGVRVQRLPENLGFAGGANAGIAAANGRAIVLLNNDARLEPGALRALLNPLEDREVGAVTALITLSGTNPVVVNSTGGEVTRSGNGRDRDWALPLVDLAREPGAVPAFSGGAVALRPEAIADVGGPFDERFFMYYEDTELSWRMRGRGWRIHYAPDARVAHRHAHSSGAGSDFFLTLNERNRLRFAMMHGTTEVIVRATWRTLAGAVARLLRRDARGALRRLGALGHSLRHRSELLRTRRGIKARRTVPPRELWRDAPRD